MKKERFDKKKPREFYCLQCSELFIRNQSDNVFSTQAPIKFCSKKCGAKYQGLKNKGENNGMFGKIGWAAGLSNQTDERINNRSKKYSGENHHNFGKKVSEEQIMKIKKSLSENEWFINFNKQSWKERVFKNDEEKCKKYLEKVKGQFNLEWFVKKYGEENGNILYKNRNKNISDTSYFKVYNQMNKNNYSNISQELFWNIYNKYPYNKIYFAELNHEHSCSTGTYNYDFVMLDKKKIIEFNGCAFHPKAQFQENWTNPYNKKITSSIQFKKDKSKIELAKNKGYDVLIVWEDEYNLNKETTLDKCLVFLD